MKKDKILDLHAFDLAAQHVNDKPKKDYKELEPKDLQEIRNKDGRYL